VIFEKCKNCLKNAKASTNKFLADDGIAFTIIKQHMAKWQVSKIQVGEQMKQDSFASTNNHFPPQKNKATIISHLRSLSQKYQRDDISGTLRVRNILAYHGRSFFH